MPDLISISLPGPDVSIEPGGTAEVEILVRNGGSGPDSAALEVEFSRLDWLAIPVAGVALDPGQTRSLRILFKPPKAPSTHADDYPFVIHARSMETGARASAQGNLHIRAQSSFVLRVSPSLATASPYQSNAQFEVFVENTGNVSETFDIHVADPESACIYQVPTERVTVAAGEIAAIQLAVQPRRRPWIGSASLYGFSVRANPLSHSSSQESVGGQLEYRALCSPLTFLLIIAAVLYVGVRAWQTVQPPAIRSFVARPAQTNGDEPVKLEYVVSHTKKLTLKNDTDSQLTTLDPSDIYTVVEPTRTTHYTVTASNDAGEQATSGLQVDVVAASAPTIQSFTSDKATVEYGQSCLLSWKVSGADGLTLAPLGKELLPQLQSVLVTPSQTTTYRLAARKGKLVSVKDLKITVNPAPNPAAPKVDFFTVTPASVHAGQSVTLSWNVSGAETVTLNGVGKVNTQGWYTFTPERTTRFTLAATAPTGAQVHGEANVVVLPPPEIMSFAAVEKPGAPTKLQWKVKYADTVVIEGIGPVESSGSCKVSPKTTTTYILRASDSAGHSVQAAATVQGPKEPVPEQTPGDNP